MVSRQRHEVFRRHSESLEAIENLLKSYSLKCTEWNSRFQEVIAADETLAQSLCHLSEEKNRQRSKTAFDLLNINVQVKHLIQARVPDLQQLITSAGHAGDRLIECIQIKAKYSRLLAEETWRVQLIEKEEALAIPADFDYFDPSISLSNEARRLLTNVKPVSIAAASRIPGVDPSDVLLLMYKLTKKASKKKDSSTNATGVSESRENERDSTPLTSVTG